MKYAFCFVLLLVGLSFGCDDQSPQEKQDRVEQLQPTPEPTPVPMVEPSSPAEIYEEQRIAKLPKRPGVK